MNVASQHRKGDVAPESFDAMVKAYVQTMNFKCVDCRFDSRMLPSQFPEFLFRFMSFVDLREPAFFWQNNLFEKLFQTRLIIWTMKTFVVADSSQVWKTLPGLFNNGDGNVAIGDVFHHLMMQDETVLIFDNADWHGE